MPAKMRKCPSCGRSMVVKKSRSGGGKFWACTGYKEGCSSTLEYFGDGAKTGTDLEIRQIENGYIVTISHKYVESAEDDVAREIHSPDKESLRSVLTKIMNEEVEFLCSRIEMVVEPGDFVDEDTPIPTTKIKGTKSIDELLRQVGQGRRKAKELEEDELVNDS